MSADGGKTMAPWVRRAWDTRNDSGDEPLDALVRSLASELEVVYPDVAFDARLLGQNVILAWRGGPSADDLADHLDVDPLGPSGEVLLGWLYGEDLPELLQGVALVIKHRA